MNKTTRLWLYVITALLTFQVQAQNLTDPSVYASEYTINDPSENGNQNLMPITIVEPGFAFSSLATMPEVMAGMAIDQSTGTIYVASQNTTSALYSVTPDGTVTLINGSWSVPPGFYPFVDTDIEYANGFVFSQISSNTLREVNVSGGAINSYTGDALSGFEAGAAVIGNNLYTTDGLDPMNIVYVRDLTTLTATPTSITIPVFYGRETLASVANNPDELVYCGDGNFHTIEISTGTVSPVIASVPTSASQFAVTPDGRNAYAYDQFLGIIRKIDLTTGVVTDFVTGIAPGAFQDLEFGPASDGSGDISLYFTDATDLYEITGTFVNPPTMVCPMDIVTTSSAGVCGAVVAFSPPLVVDIEDDPEPVPVQTMGPASGSVFPVGVTVVEFTATDSDGNTATCSFTVTVEDVEDPTLTCPADITAGSDPGICGAIVTYDAPVIADNCPQQEYLSNGDFETGDLTGWTPVVLGDFDPVFILNDGTQDPDGPGAPMAPIGGTFDLLSAQDGPSFHMISQPILVPANVTDAEVRWYDRIRNFFSDYVDGSQEFRVDLLDAAMVPITEIYSTNPGDDLIQDGPNFRQFDLTTLLQGLEGQTVYLSFQQITQLFYFNVNIDNVSFTITSTPGSVVQTAGLPSGAEFPVGTTTNTFVVTDAGGNTATCSFDVTVEDTEAPVIVCEGDFQSQDIMLNGSFETGDLSDWTAVDNP
ncbi:HYR domain-containing protein, partial [Aureisphaera galaxeae]|uniref:HYR domain-containing protein n=1 Tax=Aureisphaera galaxeae TaxID=1538023 RepID=UPI0023505763